MRRISVRKLYKRILAVLLALAQCVALSGCILENGRVDLPMAPMVTVPTVNTAKRVNSDNIKKYMIAGKDAFYLLPGIETNPEKMVDFQCFDYTTEGEFIYMYSAPSYIEGEEVAAFKGTSGKAPEEGISTPDRENGIKCDALIVMTYNPYTRDYHVLDAQAYSRSETTTKIKETEYFKADGYYMLANAYGGKLGEEERYFVLDRAGTAVVYDQKGEAVFQAAISSLVKGEIDKLVAFYYLDENGNKKEKKDDDDDDDGDADAKKEAQEEVDQETGEDSSSEPKTEDFGISERAKKAGVGVLLKSAVMDSSNMIYCSVMLYDMGSPFDPDSEVHEEVVNFYSVDLDNDNVKYLSYNRNWPKQQAEWMKLDGKTISINIDDQTDNLANALDTVQRSELGKGVTLGELLGNDIKTLQNILGIDSIKTGDSYYGSSAAETGRYNIFKRSNWTANRKLAKDFLGIDLANVPDYYSPFILGAESGFPSFIAGWTDIGNSYDRLDAVSNEQDTGYELSMEEQIFNQWMDEDLDRYHENCDRHDWVVGNSDEVKNFVNNTSGAWSLLRYLMNTDQYNGLTGEEKMLFNDIGKVNVSQTVDQADITDALSAFRMMWKGQPTWITNQLYKRKKWWFIKLGYRKAGMKSIFMPSGFTNNWKRSYYAGAYSYFHQSLGPLPSWVDYTQFAKPNTGTGYDDLADGRLYYRMNSLEQVKLTPKPGAWIAELARNATPFSDNYIEMLYAYHESEYRDTIQETSAMIYEVPSKAEGLGIGVYSSSRMEPYQWNEQMQRTIHLDFSEKLSDNPRILVSLPALGEADPKTGVAAVSEDLAYKAVESHWRDALTVYLRDRRADNDQRLYEHMTAAMKEKQISHAASVQAALNEAMKPRIVRTRVSRGLKKWAYVDKEYPSYFDENFEDIFSAMRQVSENMKNVEKAWVAYQKALVNDNDTSRFFSRRVGSTSANGERNAYETAVSHLYDPINELSADAQKGYLEFRDACIRHGVGDFLSIVRPDGMTDATEIYAEIKRNYSERGEQIYKFYYDEDAWWDVDNNWTAFVDDTIAASGQYTDDEIDAIRDVHKGLLHFVETIPEHTIPTSYRMLFPEGSTAAFASVSEQQGTATAAPQEGVILYYETSEVDNDYNTTYKSNINYIQPMSIDYSSLGDMTNFMLRSALVNYSGLRDQNVPGSAIDAGYINYRDENGELSQYLLLVTDQGVKFYKGRQATTGKGKQVFLYSPTPGNAAFIPNQQLLTSSGYTQSVEQQTSASMARMKTESDPGSDDNTILDEYGNVIQEMKDKLNSAVNAVNGNEDDEDKAAGQKQMEQEQIQEVLNAARVGSVSSVYCFTMSGTNEILISACDTGLNLFNTRTKSVVPVANGSYFRSYHVRTKKNDNAETDAVLEEQAKSKEQSYKVVGFNTDEYEYTSIDMARAKVYDLDLAGGKQVAYEQAVRQEVTQRAIDYVRMPLRTKVDDKGKIVSIPMTDEEKKEYERYKILFTPDKDGEEYKTPEGELDHQSLMNKEWVKELKKIANDIGLVQVSDSLIAYTYDLRKRVVDQSKAIADIYSLLGVTDSVIKLDPAYWNNVALRLSTAVEKDALESILVEIRMHKDVAKDLDEETRERYAAYRKIFDISTEQGAVELESVDTIIENAENIAEDPTTNAETIMEGVEETGDVHEYLMEALGQAGESKGNKRGDYYDAVIADIKALLIVKHNFRTKDQITPIKKKDTTEKNKETTVLSEDTENTLNTEETEKEEDPAEINTIVFTEEEEEDYQKTIEDWLDKVNPDNFREEMDAVLMEFVNVINMAGAKIAETEGAALRARQARIREAMPEASSVAEVEAIIISEQVQLGIYGKYMESFETWSGTSYKNLADKIAKLKANDWYKEIVEVYKNSAEVTEFLKQKNMTWDEYIKSIILRCGKGVVYDDSGKAEGATVDQDAAAAYYAKHGTMEGFTVEADIESGKGNAKPPADTTTETTTEASSEASAEASSEASMEATTEKATETTAETT